jgi:hypothetical protein
VNHVPVGDSSDMYIKTETHGGDHGKDTLENVEMFDTNYP